MRCGRAGVTRGRRRAAALARSAATIEKRVVATPFDGGAVLAGIRRPQVGMARTSADNSRSGTISGVKKSVSGVGLLLWRGRWRPAAAVSELCAAGNELMAARNRVVATGFSAPK